MLGKQNNHSFCYCNLRNYLFHSYCTIKTFFRVQLRNSWGWCCRLFSNNISGDAVRFSLLPNSSDFHTVACWIQTFRPGCDCPLKLWRSHPHIYEDSCESTEIQTFAAHSFRTCLLRPALKMNYLLLNGPEERYNYRLTHCTVLVRCVEADKSVIFFITFPHRVGETCTHSRARSILIPLSIQRPKMLLQSCQTDDVAFIKIQLRARTTQHIQWNSRSYAASNVVVEKIKERT